VDHHDVWSSRPAEIDWLWSYDIQDWRSGITTAFGLSSRKVIKNLRNFLENYDYKENQIILTHDHEETANIFLALSRHFLKEGSLSICHHLDNRSKIVQACCSEWRKAPRWSLENRPGLSLDGKPTVNSQDNLAATSSGSHRLGRRLNCNRCAWSIPLWGATIIGTKAYAKKLNN